MRALKEEAYLPVSKQIQRPATPAKKPKARTRVPSEATLNRRKRLMETKRSAIMEAADAGVPFIVAITEGIPVQDMARALAIVGDRGTRLLGPNCPGLISPGQAKVGIIPGQITTPGPVGVISRSGTLTYEAVNQLTALGIGQSTCVGIGGDPLAGTSFVDILQLFQEDAGTEAVVLIGEIGGTKEQEAAEYIRDHFTKPVVGLVVGTTAPPGRRMGHAGAIITGAAATVEEKNRALEEAGAYLVRSPGDIGTVTQAILKDLD